MLSPLDCLRVLMRVDSNAKLRIGRCSLTTFLVGGLLCFLLLGCVGPSVAMAGCGDYLVRDGRPLVSGHSLAMPLHSENDEFGELRGPWQRVPDPVPCNGVFCGQHIPLPGNLPNSIVSRPTSEAWDLRWTPVVLSSNQSVWHWRPEPLNWPATILSRLERPPRTV